MAFLRGWKSQRIGLALGSGGARGWAHLGVARALQERGLRVEVVAGTSMGSLVGAFWAADRLEVLRDLAENLDWHHLRQFFWEISLSRSGLTDGRRLLEETKKRLQVGEFRSLKLPFRAVATDLDNGEEVVLGSGDLLLALRASISIPGLFSPVRVGSRLLVDGGLVNPVPVNVARQMGAQRVLAVDVSQGIEANAQTLPPDRKPPGKSPRPLLLPKGHPDEESSGAMRVLEDFFDEVESKMLRLKDSWKAEAAKPDMMEVLVRSVRITEAQIAKVRRQTDPPDLLIEPNVGHIGTLDFQRAREAMAAGYDAAMNALD